MRKFIVYDYYCPRFYSFFNLVLLVIVIIIIIYLSRCLSYVIIYFYSLIHSADLNKLCALTVVMLPERKLV